MQTSRPEGRFSYKLILQAVENVITAKAIDVFGTPSEMSPPVHVNVQQVPLEAVTSLSLRVASKENAGATEAYLGDELIIELQGKGANPQAADTADVRFLSSITDAKGIVVQLVETGQDTGVFRASAWIGKTSNPSTQTLGAVRHGEEISPRQHYPPALM